MNISGWEFEQAQKDPAWMEWATTDNINKKVDALFTTTLPSVPQEPWWLERGFVKVGGDVWEPMPSCGRYDNEMLRWIDDYAFEYFFPDEGAVDNPNNFEIADQFVAYLARCFTARLDAALINDRDAGAPLYTFGPAVIMEFTDEIETLVSILLESARGGFDFVEFKLNSLATEKEDAERPGY